MSCPYPFKTTLNRSTPLKAPQAVLGLRHTKRLYMNRSLLFLLAILYSIVLPAQKDCRQQDYQQTLLRRFPQLQAQYGKVELFSKKPRFTFVTGGSIDTANYSPAATPVTVPEKIIIPVVVHIVWNSTAQNISDAQVLSQIDVLNKDFNGQNADRSKVPAYFSALAADCGISFVLAKRDPQGKPCNGIVRKQSSLAVFGFDDKVKSTATGGDDAWNAGNYLNIWVCNLADGISGYASAPGGPADKDGVVISSAVFGTLNMNGPFNRGRTAVHEIGHWMNLRHIWGDASCGDDKVDDTPPQKTANRGCNTGEKFSCGETAHGDMYMNFMDFSDDACMYMFTRGQRQRMRVLFETGGPRNSLLNSNGLTGEGLSVQEKLPEDETAAVEILLYPNPANNNITLQFQNNNNLAGQIYLCNHLGQIVQSTRVVAKQQQLDISSLQPGLYFIRLAGTSAVKKFVKQ